nr:oligosaccharide flippase family protein [Pseudopontixanthobacter vadosimaris]
MATLSGGVLGGRVIGLVAIPILTRIYEPADFGALSVFTALIMLLSPFVSLRYPVAIPLPRRDRLAFSLVALSFLLVLGNGLIVSVLMWMFAPIILSALSMEVLIPYWYVIVIGLVASTIFEILSAWSTRRKDYGPLARASVYQSFSGSAIKVSLGVLIAGPIGLLLGQIVSFSGGCGMLLSRYATEFRGISGKLRMGKAARLYRGFALHRLPAEALLAGSLQLPVILVAGRYSAALAGQYGLAISMIAVPSTLIVRSLSKAFYAEIASIGLKRIGEIKAITIATIKRLLLVGIPIAAMMWLVGQEASVLLFGSKWAEAGRFVELLSLVLFSSLVAAPIMRLLDLLREQKLLLAINGFRLCIVLAVFGYLPSLNYTLFDVVFVYSSAMLCLHACSGWLVLHRLNVNAEERRVA